MHLRLGQSGPARSALNDALAGSEPGEIKSRSIYMIDLATTYAQDREFDAACILAGKALEIAGPMHFGLTLDRMRGLRQHLHRWPKVRAVKDLEERLQAVGEH